VVAHQVAEQQALAAAAAVRQPLAFAGVR